MTKGSVHEETFDEWAERVGLERVAEGVEPSPDDWIIRSTWAISGPAPECLAEKTRYRPVPGGLSDPEVMSDDQIRTFQIVFENAEDGGIAIYKQMVIDNTREWMCGYGKADATILLVHACVSMMMNHANIEGLPFPEDKEERDLLFWLWLRQQYDAIVALVIEEESDESD